MRPKDKTSTPRHGPHSSLSGTHDGHHIIIIIIMDLPLEYQSPNGTVRWTKFGSGPPLVFNHGTPWSSFVWRDIAQALSSTHTVFLWDMPGYGRSDKYDGQDVSLGAQGALFAALLAHWTTTTTGVDVAATTTTTTPSPSFVVVAHDFGGAVALRARLLHGARYRALALVDPVALAPWGSPFFRLVGAHGHVFAQLPGALHAALVKEYISSASYAGLQAATLEELARPWCSGEGDDDDDAAATAGGQVASGVGQAAFYRQIQQADERFTDEVEARYGEVTADGTPAAVIWGVEDRWVPLERGRALATRMGVPLREIEGAGHLVQLDRPAQLTGALMEFLGSLPA
ncbi:alpha/beta hydrolase family domain-containing protein [Purpureocillium lavendulum]|uniref:Alpha/beta hydrolase family domain-containing protein n=1 Tax=Purpureocillium lavendulum TaxID=1247861 RepID=A0AB34FJ18_9HYPO|nr:alpha/beta hydrolase family domain-containing protein [Purpureocillium lavendulum]